MSARTPEMRFLGLAGEADDRTLLGLEPDVVLTHDELVEALEQRLVMLDRHPARLDSSAQKLRRRLNQTFRNSWKALIRRVLRPTLLQRK